MVAWIVRAAVTKRAVLILAIVSALSLIALGVLQYRWIAQLGASERKLLDASIERGTRNFREEFNTELSTLIDRTMRGPDHTPAAIAARFHAVAATLQHPQILRSLYMATGSPKLTRVIDGGVVPAEWPGYLARLSDDLRDPEDGPPPRPFWNEDPPAIAVPMAPPPRPGPPDKGPPPRNREDGDPPGWLIFEFDSVYITKHLVPELIAKHLGPGFDVEVVSTTDLTHPLIGSAIAHPDATTGFFEFHPEPPRERAGRPRRHDPPQPPQFATSRWQLRVKHQSGSVALEVAGARHRNLAITGAVLLLMALSSAALVVSLRRSEELNRMQMDFVAGVSHELRTPLSVIRSAGENLADGVVAADKTATYGALVRDEGRRLSNMVEQILRFAGVESGRAPYTFAAVSASKLIDRALEESRATLENVVVEKQIQEALPNVMADESSISHCLQNLLGNAVKYGDGKWVRVEAARQGAFVEFAIADRGPGVDPAEKRSVFNPFFRGKKAIDNQIHGLGIGLSLVKRVAETHGGRVNVRNQPDGGARFSMLIPVEE